MKYSSVIIFGILLTLGIIFTPIDLFAQTDEVIIESITQNQTTINVAITMPEQSDNISHDNGQVMISSSIIIGFVGLGSFLSISKIEHETKEQVTLLATALILVTALIILHLIIIGFAFLDDLSDIFYSVFIIATMFLVASIITCFIVMSSNFLAFKYSKHNIDAIASNVIINLINELNPQNILQNDDDKNSPV